MRTILLLLAAAQIARAAEPELRLRFSPVEKVYDHIGCPCDAVAATLRGGGDTLYTFISSAFATRKTRGTVENPFADTVWHKSNWELFKMAPGVNRTARHTKGAKNYANFYLKNVYDIDGDGRRLLGFLHLENMRGFDRGGMPTYPASHTIGLCYSQNSGDSWLFCGDIIATNDQHFDSVPHCDLDDDERFAGVLCNIGGCAYLEVGHYLYIYFNEKRCAPNTWPYTGVARARARDVVDSAQVGRKPRWHKYNNGTWDEDGLGGLASRILLLGDMHGDAVYCAEIRRYVLCVGLAEQVLAYVSADGLRWAPAGIVAQSPIPGVRVAYPWIVEDRGRMSRDGRSVEGDFVVYLQLAVERPDLTEIPMYRVRATVLPGP